MGADASKLRTGIRRVAATTMGAVGPMTAQNMRQDGRVPFRTGELRDSITGDVGARVSGTTYSSGVTAPVIQARTTDKGSPAHPIRPTRRRLLTWVGPSGRVYARYVNHPGNEPRPWFEAVLRDAYRDALRDAVRTAT